MSLSCRISPVKQHIDLTKERAEALSNEIKCLMRVAAKTGEQSKVAAISECMDQLNQGLRNLCMPISYMQDIYCYRPRDDELKTARRLLRSKGEHTQGFLLNLYNYVMYNLILWIQFMYIIYTQIIT